MKASTVIAILSGAYIGFASGDGFIFLSMIGIYCAGLASGMFVTTETIQELE